MSSDCADPGAAIPVDDGPGRLLQGAVRPPVLQRLGDAGQPGAEAEHLDLGGGVLRRVRELQQVPRVVGHRAGHVEDEDQRAQPRPALAEEQLGRLAVHPHRFPDGLAHVRDAPGAGWPRPAGSPSRRGQPDPGHDPAQGGELGGRARGERPVLERVDVRGHPAEDGLLLVFLLGPGSVPGMTRAASASAAALARSISSARGGRAVGQEELTEHPVVDSDVVAPG